MLPVLTAKWNFARCVTRSSRNNQNEFLEEVLNMKLKLCIKSMVISLVALFLLGGCAADKVQSSRRYLWPRPPDQPRIEWLKSYYGENDFPQSSFTEFVEMVFGRPAALTFMKPIDIKSNGKGTIYVTDTVVAAIFVFNLEEKKIDIWTQVSDPDAGMAITPYFIALDSAGNIYAVGTGRNEIFVLDSTGKLVRRIDFTDKVKNPAGIVVDSKTGKVFLVDNGEAKVAVFDKAGKHLFSFGKPGEDDGQFNRPSPITINHKGEVVVGDTINARVQIFDQEGKFLRKFGIRGDGSGEFQIIKGVACDTDDNIYVTDGKANQIKIFSTKGEFLMSLGSAYSITKTLKEAPGGFLLPQGIHIDDTDTIYVADQANMRFQVLKYLKEVPAGKVQPAVPAVQLPGK